MSVVNDSDKSSYTIWIKNPEGAFCRLQSFEDEILAEKYLEYVDRFCEIYPDCGIEDLYLKEDGQPIYQIYYLDSNDQEVISDDDIYFNYDEMLDEMQTLADYNPFSSYNYKEIDIDEQETDYFEIPGL